VLIDHRDHLRTTGDSEVKGVACLAVVLKLSVPCGAPIHEEHYEAQSLLIHCLKPV
jgi:hypothetical protein